MHVKLKQKKESKRGDTGFPQLGEGGCGGLCPTFSLLTYYNDLKRKGAFDS